MIYLDNAATTKPSPAAVTALTEAATQCFGNPSSLHRAGMAAHRMLRRAREQVAAALSTDPERITFTSGGTEASNLALQGLADPHRGRVLVTTDAEHPAVLRTLEAVADKGGFTLKLLSTRGGAPSLEEAAAVINADTALVAMMLVNNETGAVFPVREVGRLCRAAGARFHVDAVQGFGKLPFSPEGLLCDTLAISAHKVGGVKGAGALWTAAGVRLRPTLFGGGQEKGLRSGTEPMPAIAAFGAAAEDYRRRYSHGAMQALYDRLEGELTALGCVVHRPPVLCPVILSFSVPGMRAEPMLSYLSAREICVSAGSACAAGKKSDSHVLTAYGLPPELLKGTLRASFSPDTTEDEILKLVEGIRGCLAELAR